MGTGLPLTRFAGAAESQASATESGEKKFKRGSPAQAFARTIVDKRFNMRNLVIVDREEVESFWEKEANKIVDVFIGAALPRLMRLSKVNLGIKFVFQITKGGEFRSVIKADASNRQVFEHAGNGGEGKGCLFALDSAHPQVSCATIHHRYKKPFSGLAVHRISFPVANTAALNNDVGPLRNQSIRLNAVVVGGTRQCAFAAAAQMRFWGDGWKASEPDVAVNR